MTEKEQACDVKIWCDACKKCDYTVVDGEYLCASCGKLLHVDHEVHHEGFPHVSGDTDNLY